MSWVGESISAFGQALGMEGLELGQDGRLELAMEPDLTIRVQALLPQGEVLVACAKPLGGYPAGALRKALRLTDFREPSDWPVQTALEGGALVLQLRIPERAFTVSELETAISQLLQWQEELPETAGTATGLPVFPLGWG